MLMNTHASADLRGGLAYRAGLAVSTIAISVLGACASYGPNPQLEKARGAVQTTAQDPAVVKYAATELRAAQDTVAQADAYLKKEGDGTEVNHLAYLATQKSEIAKAVSRARAADDAVKTGNEQATQLRLQARAAEAEAAKAQAQTAQAQAQAATAQLANAKATAAAANARAASAEAQVQEMAQRMRDIEAQQTDRGLLVTLGDLLFATGRAELLPGAGARLDKLATFLTQYPDRSVLVEGHTDSTGSAALNQRLSQQRAEAVKAALVARGVHATRIATAGYAANYPLASNATAEGRAQNRRVELVIADDKGVMRRR